jgi:NAD(P)-dependent dehydrogenase (short-subunit alcohol dehydrogenase family)
MRILVIGASGTIGRVVAHALAKHDVISASLGNSAEQVDISNPDSIRRLYQRVGKLDAVVSVAGQARFRPLRELTDEDFDFSLRNKLMGQVNLVRLGLDSVNDGGSFTLTSGILAQKPMPGSAAISLVNAGVEGFGRAAALEAPRGIRVNVVSPPWVSETLTAMGQDPSGGLPAEAVAKAYVESVTGTKTGAVIVPG